MSVPEKKRTEAQKKLSRPSCGTTHKTPMVRSHISQIPSGVVTIVVLMMVVVTLVALDIGISDATVLHPILQRIAGTVIALAVAADLGIVPDPSVPILLV